MVGSTMLLTHHASHNHVDNQLHASTSTNTSKKQAALALHVTSVEQP